jgi:hypothetical protein
VTIEMKDKSTKAVLLAVADALAKIAANSSDKVDRRRRSAAELGKKVRQLAQGRYAAALADYME